METIQWILGVMLVAVAVCFQWAAGVLAGVGDVIEMAGNSLAEIER
jgi:hypothetical protein